MPVWVPRPRARVGANVRRGEPLRMAMQGSGARTLLQWARTTCHALVAQGIEHRSPKAGVGRSNRLGGTENLDISGKTDRDSEWQKHSESRSTLFALKNHPESVIN